MSFGYSIGEPFQQVGDRATLQRDSARKEADHFEIWRAELFAIFPVLTSHPEITCLITRSGQSYREFEVLWHGRRFRICHESGLPDRWAVAETDENKEVISRRTTVYGPDSEYWVETQGWAPVEVEIIAGIMELAAATPTPPTE
jgi:hypothetical protein